MNDVLNIIVIALAIIGGLYLVSKLLFRIILFSIRLRVKKQDNIKIPPPKYTRVENCPICGSNSIDIFENYSVREGEQVLVGYSIGCKYCGLRSPVLDSMEQCIDYWNTRKGENNQGWIVGEPEVVYKEVEYGESRQSTSEEINNKSDVI